MHALSLRGTKMLKVTRKSMLLGPLFLGIFGLVFLVEGLRQDDRLNFASCCGAAFLVFALGFLVTNLRAFGGGDQVDS